MSNYLDDLRENAPRILPVTEQEDIHEKIVDFFKTNPNPGDDDVHDFAETLRMDKEDFENHIYMVLTEYIKNSVPLKNIGKHRDVPDEKFNPEELAMGIKVEYEHTDDPGISKEIAKDHLSELPDYYTRLREMEEVGEMEVEKIKSSTSQQEQNVAQAINPTEQPETKVTGDEERKEKCPFYAAKEIAKEIKGAEE
jgi:hypothetical protein